MNNEDSVVIVISKSENRSQYKSQSFRPRVFFAGKYEDRGKKMRIAGKYENRRLQSKKRINV